MKLDFPSYHSYTPRKLREFGIVWSVFFVLLAGGSIWKAHWHLGHRTVPYLIIAGAWLALALLLPRVLRPLLHAWMLFGTVAGHITTTLMLALLYVFVVTPMGLIVLVRGQHLLDEGVSPQRKSYWIAKQAAPPSHFHRLFVVNDVRPQATGPLLLRGLRALAAFGLGFMVMFVYAEIGLRAFHRVSQGRPLLQAPRGEPMVLPDQGLGWRPMESLQISGISPNADGSRPPFHASFDAHGFRAWGDLAAARPRVLALGDSFTWAESVDDRDTWFAVLGRGADVEMFGYGAGGWGTLQETLALERHINTVNPDVVILQMTGNDFINNTIDLEWDARGNNRTRRPFWVDDHIEYVRPVRFPHVRDFAERVSRVGMFVLFRYDQAMLKRRGLEDDIWETGASHPGFVRAAAVTRQVLRRFRQSAGGRPVIAFMVRKDHPEYETATKLCQEEGIIFDDHVPAAVDAAKAHGIGVFLADGHWNGQGHTAAGQALVPALKQALHSRTHGPRPDQTRAAASAP